MRCFKNGYKQREKMMSNKIFKILSIVAIVLFLYAPQSILAASNNGNVEDIIKERNTRKDTTKVKIRRLKTTEKPE